MVVDHFGTQTGVAVALGYPDVRNVTPWTTGKRWFPEKQCVALERKSNGTLTRAFLRPLDFWEIWPDLPSPAANDADAAQGAQQAGAQ